MLAFFIAVFFFGFTDRWWIALGCIVGFVVAAFLIRRMSTIEPDVTSRPGTTLL